MATDSSKAKVAGVLGGMGPQATVDFMAKVVAMTKAATDQEHVRMIVDHNPQVPDRQYAFDGDDGAVRESLQDMALRLENAGADFLVMPCNTASAFLDEARASVTIPFLDIVDESVKAASRAFSMSPVIGLLATTACLQSGLYQAACDSAGCSFITLSDHDQQQLMQLIMRIKSNDAGKAVGDAMLSLAESLRALGAEVIVAGCTEIPIVLTSDMLAVPLVSSTDVLAARTIEVAKS